jgi:DUF1680 family protein
MAPWPGYRFAELPVGAWTPGGGFWGTRTATAFSVTLPHCWSELDRTGRLRNFLRAAGQLDGAFEGRYPFDDSDLYKTLEAYAYQAQVASSPAVDRVIDQAVELIRSAQLDDGYLMTWFQLKGLDGRWTDMSNHEMYTGGHLFEAAAALAERGDTRLLEVAVRLADHYLDTFGPGRRHWVDSHEEVGIGLARLALATGDDRYRAFAHWHLEERGRGYGHGHVWDLEGFGATYSQYHIPVRNIREPEGHAVRAMYLYSAMADIGAWAPEPAYLSALQATWNHLVARKLYITGGIGSEGRTEGFGPDFHLPNATAYCETCAAIGMVFWNHRMNLLTGEARYADLVERELYNGALAGIGLSGDRFFYDNPLASDGSHRRAPWFTCACCPPNLARLLASLGRYAIAFADDTIVVNQFMSGTATIPLASGPVTLRIDTALPWGGRVRLTLDPGGPRFLRLWIRRPAWAPDYRTWTVNGDPGTPAALPAGYWEEARVFRPHDTIAVELPLAVRRVHGHPQTENRDAVALERGPLVYCFEGADNPRPVDTWCLADTAPVELSGPIPLDGALALEAPVDGGRLTAVPYYAWANRDPGPMRVWIPHKP